MKNDLPRIRYANPRLEIELNKLPKTEEETWKPEMVLELRASCINRRGDTDNSYNTLLGDGTTHKIDLHRKWSSTIYKEVLDTAGGPLWETWKQERAAAGLPAVDIPRRASNSSSQTEDNIFSSPSPFRIDPTKTGAAAVLP